VVQNILNARKAYVLTVKEIKKYQLVNDWQTKMAVKKRSNMGFCSASIQKSQLI
jgi:hypothetical protein